MRFVVMAWDGDDPDAKERRAAVRPVHLENIQPFVDDGHVLVGGAMLDDQGDMIGSTLVVEFDSRVRPRRVDHGRSLCHGRRVGSGGGPPVPAGGGELAHRALGLELGVRS